MVSHPPLQQLRQTLLDQAENVGKRNHAAYLLRTLGGAESIEAIQAGLRLKPDSTLLRHELAYILGQMQDESACCTLEEVLADTADDVMVRHEAAEALGAIGASRSEDVLRRFTSDPAPEVAQTCELALALMSWRREQAERAETDLSKNPYQSVDPAPATAREETILEMEKTLLDPSASLFARYRAMFGLRNAASEESVLALSRGLVRPGEDCSLFKHEIAYVLGQMEHPASIPALVQALSDESEHAMVRHEAAEALGAIGGETVESVLKDYEADSEDVVKQSCQVALSTADYWAQYANST